MESLEDLIKQLKTLEQKINQKIDEQKIPKPEKKIYENKTFDFQNKYSPLFKNQMKEFHRKFLDSNSRYFLATFTFDPKVILNIDKFDERRRLIEFLDKFNEFQYFGCLEKHKSGILHAHMLIQHDIIHDIEMICYKNKKLITKSCKLSPSIQIKVVKQSEEDIDRSYDYIWDDKSDHPKFKYIKINI